MEVVNKIVNDDELERLQIQYYLFRRIHEGTNKR